MDITTLSAATDLRDLMVAHEVASRQLTALDGHLSDLGQRSFTSDVEGSTVQKLRLLLRVSVSEGMRLVYNQYCQRKQQQVQQTARDIIARLEGDNNESAANQEVMLGEVNRGQAGTDRSAGGWTSMDSMFYRGS